MEIRQLQVKPPIAIELTADEARQIKFLCGLGTADFAEGEGKMVADETFPLRQAIWDELRKLGY